MIPADITWLSVEEIAVDLRVSKMTIYRLISLGEIPSITVGRTIRVHRDAYDAYLTQSKGDQP